MLRRSFTWVVAAVLLVAAGSVLALQVEIGGDGRDVSCGSGFDVLAGRAGWEDWWAQDLTDPAGGTGGRLVRAEDCAGAINNYVLVAGVLAAGAVSALVVAVAARHRSQRLVSTQRTSPAQQLQHLGIVLALVGGALTIGGVIAMMFLVADPDSTLFLYVDRLVVTIIGAIVLIPALALVFAGRAIDLVGRHLARSQNHDADA